MEAAEAIVTVCVTVLVAVEVAVVVVETVVVVVVVVLAGAAAEVETTVVVVVACGQHEILCSSKECFNTRIRARLLTVLVIVEVGSVVVAVVVAVYVFDVVVLAMTNTPQVTADGYCEKEPLLPTGGQIGLWEMVRSSTGLPRMARSEDRFLGT